ncbi:PH domain-containing protein [Lachnoclostridium sp.]|nr:PH domain-containing protein [Lachnoclostridium sp.]
MIVNIIMLISMLPILPIIYYLMINEAEPKKNIVLGVTLPADQLDNSTVLQIVARYKKELRIWTICLIPVLIIPFFIKSFAIGFSIQMLWILVVVMLSFYPFAKYNQQLLKIKKDRDWVVTYTNTVVVDMRAASEIQVRGLTIWYLLLSVISFAPIGYAIFKWKQDEYFKWNITLLVTMASITLLCFLMNFLLRRQKGEVISEDSLRNTTMTRIRRKAWNDCFLSIAVCNTVYVVITYFYLNNKMISTMNFMLATMLYSVVIVFISIYSEFKVRKLQRKFSIDQPMDVVVDDDSNWIFGMLYYNPRDKHTLIAKRVGIGTTYNLATKAGKVITGLVLIALLSIPLSCVWIFFEEFTPISLQVENQEVIATHLKEEYKIPLNEIIELEYLTSLPRTSKKVGTGMDNLYKGDFSVKGYGNCEVCLNPETEAFLVLHTKEETYIFSDETTEKTLEVYKELKEVVQ